MRRFDEPSAGGLVLTILSGGVLVCGAVLAIGLSETPPVPGMRLFTPLAAVVAYWLFTLDNRRSVILDASGVRVTFGPLPNCSGHFVPRSQIACCYFRDFEDPHEDQGYFGIGVETRAGHQIDCYTRHARPETALAAARELSQILNANPAEPPIETRQRAFSHTDPILMREVLCWSLLGLAAFALGAAWE